MTSIEIDGNYLEGGGSIVRVAVALSAVSRKSCKIFNIRAKRRNPGLQAQHKTAVQAVAKLCDAKLSGVEIGSQEIEFHPKEISGGSLSLNIGTAGSIPLVLQSLMIPAIHSEKPVDIKITGGTMIRWSPTIGYIQNVTLSLLKKFGYNGEIILHKHGFYPKGGGLVESKIQASEIKPIKLLERGNLMRIEGSCIASKDLEKPRVAERMRIEAQKLLVKEFQIQPEIKCKYVDSISTGCGIDLFAFHENSIHGANSIGERGKRAEDVGKEAAEKLIEQIKSGAAVDEYAEDQLIPYMALATKKGSSIIRVPKLTQHTHTNLWVVEKFLSVKFEVEGNVLHCKKL